MWIVYSILGAFAAAVVVTLSKAGLKDVSSNLAFAIQSVMILIVSWSAVFWQGQFNEVKNIERGAWTYLLLAGVITCVSSLLIFAALKLGDASRISPIDKISLVFSIALASFFLKERISWQIIVGACLMVTGAIVIALANHPNE
jgi:transporter family protein